MNKKKNIYAYLYTTSLSKLADKVPNLIQLILLGPKRENNTAPKEGIVRYAFAVNYGKLFWHYGFLT